MRDHKKHGTLHIITVVLQPGPGPVSNVKRKAMFDNDWPQAHPSPRVLRWPGSGRVALPARSAPPTPIGGRRPARSGPAAGQLPLQQRRLQVFIPTVREEPKSPPTKSKIRKDQIFPEINASQKRFQFNPAENLLHLRGLRSYSAEKMQRRA